MKKYAVLRVSAAVMVLFAAGVILFSAISADTVSLVIADLDKRNNLPVVVLDAGHGGEDGGAVGVNGVLEKDINLSIVLKIAEILSDDGFSVKLIRSTDTSVGDFSLSTVSERKRSDIKSRVQTVNATENCILVSIHQNIFEQPQYSGAQMFYSPNNPGSALLAECIRNEVVSRIQPENHRENKSAENGIFLLKNVAVPAVIVECGFISNSEEAALLAEPSYQEKMAEAIAAGIVRYLGAE